MVDAQLLGHSAFVDDHGITATKLERREAPVAALEEIKDHQGPRKVEGLVVRDRQHVEEINVHKDQCRVLQEHLESVTHVPAGWSDCHLDRDQSTVCQMA